QDARRKQLKEADEKYPSKLVPFVSNQSEAVDVSELSRTEQARRDFLAQSPIISGDVAFKLHDTYGFPLDLTQLMAEERGMTVDVEGFETLMERARERSRGDAGDGEADLREQLVNLVQRHNLPATEFLGYDTTECVRDVELRAFPLTGGRVAVVVSATPFYAEAGGQVGDTGVIQVQQPAATRYTVEDTQKVGDVIFHIATTPDPLEAEIPTATVAMAVDRQRRELIQANHTMTHVMNRALRDAVNPEADQKGSLVDAEKLRFDFTHAKAVTPEQIERVEQQVNADIAADLKVDWAFAPQEQARQI